MDVTSILYTNPDVVFDQLTVFPVLNLSPLQDQPVAKPSSASKDSVPSGVDGGLSEAAGGVAEAGGDAGAKKPMFTNRSKVHGICASCTDSSAH